MDAGYEIVPVFSYNVSTLDTRFFKQADFEKYIVEKTGKTPINKAGIYLIRSIFYTIRDFRCCNSAFRFIFII